jgi:hypothetical protein
MSSQGPSLLDQVCAAVRLRHYSIRTEETYVNVISSLKACFSRKKAG